MLKNLISTFGSYHIAWKVSIVYTDRFKYPWKKKKEKIIK